MSDLEEPKRAILKLDTKDTEEALIRIKKLLEEIQISIQEVKELFKTI